MQTDCELLTSHHRREGILALVPRVLAGVLGGFTLLNLLAGSMRPGFDANVWWIDLRAWPAALASALLAVGGVLLCAWAYRPVAGVRRARATRGVVGLLALACMADALRYGLLVHAGRIHTSAVLPLSLFVAAGLVWIVRSVRAGGSERAMGEARPVRWRKRRAVAAVTVCGATLILWALAQMTFYGRTDYRRDADAIVVFGAGVYADGRCSDALADRMRTGIELYTQGYAPMLIVSGGPGMGDVHETEAMRDFAIAHGVAADAICLDRQGLSTAATARNTVEMFRRLGCSRVLAVSHSYHLPRVKLAYQRAGWDVFTVPAKESYVLTAMPYYMTREIAALWCYYLRPPAA